jgi:hypothetical protein
MIGLSLDVRAEARTYLKSNGKNKSDGKSKSNGNSGKNGKTAGKSSSKATQERQQQQEAVSVSMADRSGWEPF